jgi:hypothetical protein
MIQHYGRKQGNIQEKTEEGGFETIGGLTSIWAVFKFWHSFNRKIFLNKKDMFVKR